jgi:uncharacterized membrane protein YfcA
LLAGVLNGLIVLGGGVLITPLLFVTGVRPQIAVGTSLAALTMLSCIGFSAHLLLDGIALGLVPIVAAVLGGAVRSMIGSKILARLTPHWMLMLFAIVGVPVAVRLIDQGLGTALLGTVIPSGAPLRAYAAFGLFAGILSGIFGVGGGGFFMFIGIMLARKGWAVAKNAGNGGSASA